MVFKRYCLNFNLEQDDLNGKELFSTTILSP